MTSPLSDMVQSEKITSETHDMNHDCVRFQDPDKWYGDAAMLTSSWDLLLAMPTQLKTLKASSKYINVPGSSIRDLFGWFKWSFQGLSDLHVGDQVGSLLVESFLCKAAINFKGSV